MNQQIVTLLKKHTHRSIWTNVGELGLHPAALGVLADIIQAVSKVTQVICSTQSVTFANFFAPEDFIVVDAKEGVSHFQRLDKKPLNDWLDEYAIGDLWAKNLIGGRPQW